MIFFSKKIESGNWPFADPPNTAAITTKRIAFKEYPILRVIHDGDRQFLDGEDVTTSDGLVAALQELIQGDTSLESIANLSDGWQA